MGTCGIIITLLFGILCIASIICSIWDYNTALMYKIKYFFAFDCAKFSLKPPTYSRNTYKLGFRSPKHFGNSYKLANFKVKMYFKNKS